MLYITNHKPDGKLFTRVTAEMKKYWLRSVIGELSSCNILNVLARTEIHILKRTTKST